MRKSYKKWLVLMLAAALFIPQGLVAPKASAAPVTVYHETFEGGIGDAQSSGGASLSRVTDKVFDGNADGNALYVDNRTADYSAADFMFSAIGLENGKTYTATVKGYVDEDVVVPAGAQTYLQTAASAFDFLHSANFVAGQAFTLTGEFTVGSSSDNRLRVQSNPDGATVPFYIGDILITGESTSTEPTTIIFHDFENEADGTQGWLKRGPSETVTRSTAAGYDGSTASILSDNRTADWNGPGLNLLSTGLLVEGGTYEFTSYVLLKDGTDGAADIRYGVKRTALGEDTYANPGNAVSVTAGEWQELTAQYTYEPDANDLELYLQSSSPDVSFHVDNFSVKVISLPETPDPEDDIVLTEGFENGIGSWDGNGGTISISDEIFRTDEHSLTTTGRTANWNGPRLELTNLLEKGAKYEISGYVKLLEGQPASELKITMVEIPSAGGDTIYTQVTPLIAVTDAEWVELKDDYTYDPEAAEIYLQFESNYEETDDAVKNVSFALDDVVIRLIEPAPLDQSGITSDFEDGLQGWVSRDNNGTVDLSTAANHTEGGTQSLLATAPGQYDGPLLNVLGKMHRNHKYELSVWVRMVDGEQPTQLRLSVQHGSSSFANVSTNVTVTDEQWYNLSGEFTLTSNPTVLNAYVETATNNGETRSFYIDDFSLTHLGAVDGPAPIQDLTPIKEVYEDYFLIGNAVSSTSFNGLYLELLTKHFNVVTAENAMKPDALQRVEGTFTTAAAAELIASARALDMDAFGHVLVWHQQSPEWMTSSEGEPLSREDALENMRNHIEGVMTFFGDTVIGWDVVNEAMSDGISDPSNWESALRDSPWKRAIGDDYVKQAFLIAREVADDNEWDLKLYYNDYNEDNQNKATAIYNMIKEINDEYAAENEGRKLIDGMGMQSHYNINTSIENVRLSLERFISLDIEVSVTELDIMAGSNNQATQEQLNAQAYLYAQLFALYKEHAEHIPRVTLWGLDDQSSWRAQNSPLPFDRRLQAKEAYYAIIDPEQYLEDNTPVVIEPNRTTAAFGTPVIDGTIDAVWSKAPEIPINRYQSAWQGAGGTAKALWDNQNLYVLFQVTDAELDKSSAERHEQDSVEVFVDENNAKSASYQADDGQYRINFDNEASFNPSSIADGFESATQVNGTNYIVEVKIPLRTITPNNGTEIGFDVQINDAKNGSRQSIATWNDTKGTGWQDTSVYGVLTLTGKGTGAGPIIIGGGTGEQTGSVDSQNGIATIKPAIKTENGRTIGTITSDNLSKALELAEAAADGNKHIIVELPQQDGANSYEVQLPTESLQSQEAYALTVKTAAGTIQIPSDMLLGISIDTEQVSIRLADASTENLDEAVREQIGDRPVIELHVSAGDSIVPWNNPGAPVTVSLPYTPTADELANPDHIIVWYIDGNGNAKAVPNGRYDAASGTVVFQTTHFSKFAVVSVFKSFGDLENVAWAKAAVDAMASRDVIKGTSENSFTPAAPVRKADFIALLVRALELQGSDGNEAMFSDVPATAYYYSELAIAKELGIAVGSEDNTFDPLGALTRQDMMVLTTRALAAAGKPLADGGSLDAFSDAADVSEEARDSVAALVESGIVLGRDGKLAPNDTLTRAEAAVILYRIWKL